MFECISGSQTGLLVKLDCILLHFSYPLRILVIAYFPICKLGFYVFSYFKKLQVLLDHYSVR